MLSYIILFSDNNQQFWNNEIFRRMKNGICAFIVVPGESSECYININLLCIQSHISMISANNFSLSPLTQLSPLTSGR